MSGDGNDKDYNALHNDKQFYVEGYFDSAYPMPAGTDGNHLYQIKLSSAPPAFPPHEKKKPHRFFALLILSVLLLALSYFVTIFVIKYELNISRNNGDLTFTIREKQNDNEDKHDIRPQNSVPPADNTHEATLPPPSTNTNPGNHSLLLMSPPSDDTPVLSNQQIYKKCIDSLVSLYVSGSNISRSGTGIVLTSDGYIITNQHLIADASSILVVTSDGTEYPASIYGVDRYTDIAVLKIDATELKPAEFGDSDSVEEGDEVFAIGNPVVQKLTITNGIISAINPNIKIYGYKMTMFQTNASMSDASAGGALVNLHGQVIGITKMLVSNSGTSSEAIGFAIPVSLAKPVIDNILIYRYVPNRPSLGISVQDVPAYISVYNDLPLGSIYVAGIWTNSDAYKAGIVRGDYIVAVNGTQLNGQDSFNAIINSLAVGDIVTLLLYRNNEQISVDVQVMDAYLFETTVLVESGI